jgi:hypothetical protein
MYTFLLAFLLTLLAFITIHFVTSPSNDRDWNEDQATLSYADISGDTALIHNIRNFTYASTTSFTRAYYDKSFDLTKIVRAWYIVEPFSGIPGSAHTFLSFEFEGGQFVSISVEIRKQKGESFHPLKGLFNQYELMYVIADERDVVKLRTNYRKDLVYIYPIKARAENEYAAKQKVRALFVGMLERANHLKDHPEFYNSVTNTCTTNIVDHVNNVTPSRIPFMRLGILFPALSDKLAYKLGLIDTDLSFEDARKKYFANDRAMEYADDEDFSVKIREEE